MMKKAMDVTKDAGRGDGIMLNIPGDDVVRVQDRVNARFSSSQLV